MALTLRMTLMFDTCSSGFAAGFANYLLLDLSIVGAPNRSEKLIGNSNFSNEFFFLE